jgi:hypothetical protein
LTAQSDERTEAAEQEGGATGFRTPMNATSLPPVNAAVPESAK